MKKILSMTLAMLTLAVMSCSKDDETPAGPKTEDVLQGVISANKTLTSDKIWVLKGYVYVANGVTLKIEPGTIIKGDLADKGILVVERGGKINAQGTVDNPIVFTSARPAGERAAGDWGGIFICGKGITNQGTEVAGEGGIQRNYGGLDDTDSSGVLSYVRIEFAGFVASANSEVNALSLGAVGSKTKIDHVQIWYPKDDGIECWGGAVNLKYVAIFGTSDDDLDFDFGYKGKIQYAYIVKDPRVADQADQSNGIECDNENATGAPTPTTRPVISNVTLCGPNDASADSHHNYAMRWRRDANFAIYNSVFAGWLKAGFSMESTLTATSYLNNVSAFKYNLVHSIAAPYLTDADATAVITAAAVQTKAESQGGVTMTSATQVLTASAFSLTAPNAMPVAGSAATTGGTFTDADLTDSFFDKVTFRGAFGTTNWLQGGNWISFSAQTAAYK
jgi:hypothetical protein